MGWFGLRSDAAVEELASEIRELRKQVANLQGEKAAAAEALRHQNTINDLRKQIVTLEIEKSKRTEEHEREKRDVQHMVGLERKRQEFEISQARRETTVTVREENLKADRARFEEQMDFLTKRFEKEVGYLKEILTAILGRLPSVDVNLTRSGGNGKEE